MPYVDSATRERLKPILDPLLNAGLSEGEATYIIDMLMNTLYGWGDYAHKSKGMGVMTCALLEYWFKVLRPHEDDKCDLHGEIFK